MMKQSDVTKTALYIKKREGEGEKGKEMHYRQSYI